MTYEIFLTESLGRIRDLASAQRRLSKNLKAAESEAYFDAMHRIAAEIEETAEAAALAHLDVEWRTNPNVVPVLVAAEVRAEIERVRGS